MTYSLLDNEQRRAAIDQGQVFASYQEVMRDWQRTRGGLSWQRTGGKEYLVRTLSRGIKKSLGPRSPDTERYLADFRERKAALQDKRRGLESRLARQAGVCRALGLGRVPKMVAAIVRALADVRLDHKTTTIIGTHALYAYESLAGVHFASDLLATRDLDMLWDARSRLQCATRIPPQGLLAILRTIDRSFSVLDHTPFRAVNREGFLVDLLQEPVPMHKTPTPSFAPEDDFVVVEAPVQWLIASPKVSAVALDERGFPVSFSVPDPRAFALHKLWVSRRPDRDPVKKPRDAAQAIALVALIQRELPQFAFSETALQMFPQSVRNLMGDAIRKETEEDQTFGGWNPR